MGPQAWQQIGRTYSSLCFESSASFLSISSRAVVYRQEIFRSRIILWCSVIALCIMGVCRSDFARITGSSLTLRNSVAESDATCIACDRNSVNTTVSLKVIHAYILCFRYFAARHQARQTDCTGCLRKFLTAGPTPVRGQQRPRTHGATHTNKIPVL